MATPRRTLRACVPALAVLFALICAVVGPAGAVAGPAASGSPRPAASSPPSLTGHWAIAGTSGLDLVQQGTSVSGTSAMGVTLAGSVAGRTVSFRWWSGPSFDRSKKSERGTGTMTLSIGGDELAIAARDDEAGPGPFPSSFNAVRVHDIIATPTRAPLWPEYWTWTPPQVMSATRAYLDFVCDAWICRCRRATGRARP